MVKLPKAVFFDWNGTLVDSFRFLHTAHNHVRNILGIEPFTLEVFEGYFGQPREKLYKELYGDHIESAKAHFERFVLENHMKYLQPMPGAVSLLESLHKLAIPCGVVSNKKVDLIHVEIKSFDWERFFVSVVGAGEASVDKPSPAPLLLAIERSRLNLNCAEVWFIGDTDNDLQCAQAAGAISVLIAKRSDYENLSKRFRIDLHAENCDQIRAFLLQ